MLFALLLGPLVAAALLHSALTQLSSNPDAAVPKAWKIESPLVLPSTPIRRIGSVQHEPTDAIRALSALATSRRNLVQLFTLSSFVLLVQLAWSLRLELRLAPANASGASGPFLESVSTDPAKAIPLASGPSAASGGEVAVRSVSPFSSLPAASSSRWPRPSSVMAYGAVSEAVEQC